MPRFYPGGARSLAFRVLWFGLLAAFSAPTLATACTVDSLGNSGSGAYAIQSTGVLEAVQAQSAYSFSMSSISINIFQISGTAQLNVAFYGDAGGAPGSLLAQSSSGPQAAVIGWNTFMMPALTYTAGAYWLAFQASTSGVYFCSDFSASTGINTKESNPFGTFPATWTGGGFNDFLWSDYAQICSDAPTPTPTFTGTVSASPTLTPAQSSTPSPVPSWTQSPTPTDSPSPAATATATPTWMPTLTPTPSPTATISPTESGTATATETWSPSATATGTPPPSPSPTGAATATQTRTPPPTRSPSPSFTASATPAPSLTPACASGPVWPNPFTPTLGTNQEAQFCVPVGHGAGTLMIYTLKRRLIRGLAFGPGQPVAWDGRDAQGSVVLFGVYPYLLQCGGRVMRGAVTVLR